jgi:hypothetical protein
MLNITNMWDYWKTESLAAVLGCSATYLLYTFINRNRYVKYLEDELTTCDDLHSAHNIVRIINQLEFPFIATKSLEFGLFRTYGIPSISRILNGTKELTDRCARRYDDTDFLIREFIENPPNSRRAQIAIGRMNFIHGHYKSITNEDYLYVLAVFMIEPIRWIDRIGFRRAHWKEKRALFMVWRDIGLKMGIQDMFSSEEEAVKYYDDYEEKHMVFAQTNHDVGMKTLQLFLSIVPSVCHPLGRQIVYSLCDKRLRTAMGFPDPPMVVVLISHLMLHVSWVVTRVLLLSRRTPRTRTPATPCTSAGSGCPIKTTRNTCAGSICVPGARDYCECSAPENFTFMPHYHVFNQIYPDGYRISELGPIQWVSQRELGPVMKSDMK